MKNYYTLLILTLCYLSAKAQSPCYWKLTDDDGLPNMEVYGLYQDTKGYIWIATDGGIVRYDGTSITHYTHPRQRRNSAADIQEDHKGNIWYKNFAGQLFFIDEEGGRTGKFPGFPVGQSASVRGINKPKMQDM